MLCVTNMLRSNDEQTLYYCGHTLTPRYDNANSCAEQRRRGNASAWPCPEARELDLYARWKSFEALAQWRSGKSEEAMNSLSMALFASKERAGWPIKMINIAITTPDNQKLKEVNRLRQELSDPKALREFDFARSRIFARQLATIKLEFYVSVAALSAVAMLGIATAYRKRVCIAAFLRILREQYKSARERRKSVPHTRPDDHAIVPMGPQVQAAFPVTHAAYSAAYPAAWQARHMNRSYQAAAWCYAAIWILIALPLVLALAIPALTLLGGSLQAAAANFRWFVNEFLEWVRLWYGLLLFSLAGFGVFKVYGRYSLPKPFRPKIRIVRTTFRVVFLVTTLLSVGTFIMYFSEQASNLYDNPLVRMFLQFLRELLGV